MWIWIVFEKNHARGQLNLTWKYNAKHSYTRIINIYRRHSYKFVRSQSGTRSSLIKTEPGVDPISSCENMTPTLWILFMLWAPQLQELIKIFWSLDPVYPWGKQLIDLHFWKCPNSLMYCFFNYAYNQRKLQYSYHSPSWYSRNSVLFYSTLDFKIIIVLNHYIYADSLAQQS